MRGGLVTITSLALGLVALAGCPSGPCAPVEKGGRCVDIACPSGAHVDGNTKICVCGEGAALVAGACVPFKTADAFCGHVASPQAGACLRKHCGVGEALDVDHGFCLPESTTRIALTHAQHEREEETKMHAACTVGAMMHHHGTLSCAVGPLSCGRGEAYVKAADAGAGDTGTCWPAPTCGAGELYDAPRARCERVVRDGRNRIEVDVGSWARVALGADGAEGSNAFCAPVRATAAAGRFQIELSFRDNDITQASGRLVSRGGTMPQAGDAAQLSLEQLMEILRFLGGTASAASVSLEVVCTPSVAGIPTLEMVH